MLALVLEHFSVNDWQAQVLRFSGALRELRVAVPGLIGNSVPTSAGGQQRTAEWKDNVATAVMLERGLARFPVDSKYAITVCFSFHLPSHGNQLCDIENFLKPTLDAIAAGLFADFGQYFELSRWNFDDSRFHHVLTHRMPDAASADAEGAALFVSIT